MGKSNCYALWYINTSGTVLYKGIIISELNLHTVA